MRIFVSMILLAAAGTAGYFLVHNSPAFDSWSKACLAAAKIN